MYDYRELRWNTLNSDRYRHLLLLIFWPTFGLIFALLERVGVTDTYHYVSCALDSLIPFCEYFFIPYLFWFVFLIGMLAYTILFDVPAFKRMMYFIIFTYVITIIIYIIYPTAQLLRPMIFPRDNLLTKLVIAFYAFDTNTNVCPSLHVVGSVAVMFAAWDTKHFGSKPGWRIAFFLVASLISISTLFLKQHSVIDVATAALLCIFGYLVIYRWLKKK